MKFIYRVLGRLPLPLLYCLAQLMAFALYRIVRYRRRVVADNLAFAFPELSTEERHRIEKGVYAHLSDLSVEIIAARRMPRAEFQRRLTLENPEVLLPFKNREQGVLFLTSHQGNWEWLLHVVSDYMGCPIDAVYKTLHNADFDAFVFDVRARSGKPIAFKDTGREMLRRRREFRGFAMLADQAPFKRDKRYWHTFFGRPGSFYLGPQVIAEAAQYPVVFVGMTMKSRGHYSAYFEVLAEPPHAKGDFAIINRYIETLEHSIRKQPEIWMWSNRKWKHNPPADWQENPVG